MKNKKNILFSLFFLIVILVLYNYNDRLKINDIQFSMVFNQSDNSKYETIHLASVVCGSKTNVLKMLPLIKSAILMSQSKLNFHLFVENETKAELEKTYLSFSKSIRNRVEFIYYQPWFPQENYEWWLKVYKRCVTEKIFLPRMIKNVSSVIYLDLDTLIVGRLENIWKIFNNFGDDVIMGASNDCPFDGCAYYLKVLGNQTHVPAIFDSGLNGGVLFMRLDRMRDFNFEEKIVNLSRIYQAKLKFAEQDLLNILFHDNIGRVIHVDCSFNYFPLRYCPSDNICNTSDGGLKIIHGADRQFERNGTFFNMLIRLIVDVDLSKELNNSNDLVKEIRDKILKLYSRDGCNRIKNDIFL